MSSRELTPEEKAVFSSIIKQREQSGRSDDFILYSVNMGQKLLANNGDAARYGIGMQEHHKIIRKLADDGIICANWITGKTNDGELRFADSDEENMWNIFGVELILTDDDACRDGYFIKISFNEIKEISDRCFKRYSATLSISNFTCLVVACDGNRYFFPCLHDGGRPYEVISYAMEHFGEKISKKELSEVLKSKGCDLIDDIPFGKVFERNHTIREVLSPFIELKPKYICVVENAKLTSWQLALIKKECKSFSKL